MTTYTYSLSSDFGGSVDASQLHEETVSSAIAVTLSRVDIDGDDVKIVFPSVLSGGDQTLLDGIVSSHSPIPLEEEFKNSNCYIYSTGALNIYDETASFDIPLNQEDVIDSGFTHIADSPEIKVLNKGTYRIEYKVTTQSINGTSTGKFCLESKHDAGVYSVIVGSEGFYSSVDPEQTTIQSSIMCPLEANDTIKMCARGLGSGDIFILVANNSGVLIHRV